MDESFYDDVDDVTRTNYSLRMRRADGEGVQASALRFAMS